MITPTHIIIRETALGILINMSPIQNQHKKCYTNPMFLVPGTSLIAFFLLTVLGVLTSASDIRYHKIRNQHLIIVFIAAVILYWAAACFLKISISMHLLSAAVGGLTALLFYHSDIWRAGDAKLFFVYAFIMPATGYEKLMQAPCVPLLTLAFLVMLIILLPSIWSAFVTRHKRYIASAFSLVQMLKLSEVVLKTLGISWITQYLLHTANSRIHLYVPPVIHYVIFFIIFKVYRNWNDQRFALVPWFTLAAGPFLFPQFFTPGNLWQIIARLFIYSVLFGLLFDIINDMRDLHDRVPFAPFLFIACLLSYTPTLTWILRLYHL